MKKLFLFFCLFFSFSLFAQNELQEAINRQNWLKVDRLMNNDPYAKDNIPQAQYYLIRAATDNALARYDESARRLQIVSEMQEVKENPQLMVTLLTLQADNYAKMFRHRQAAETFKRLTDDFSVFLGEVKAITQNSFRRHNALSEVEPLQVRVPYNTKIQLIPDKKDLLQVQVRTPKDSVLLVFDTGGGMSSVTKSAAERLGIRILTDSIIAGGATGNTEFMSIGVADTLFVGDILYKNVVFGIFDDELFSWSEADYYINGVLGFPEIRVLPSMKMYNKSNIIEVFPATKDFLASNMLLTSHQKIIEVNDSLLFLLDTGALLTCLSVAYYNRNKEYIHESGQLSTTKIGGMGEIREFSVYNLNNFPIKIGETTTILPEISVFTEHTIGRHDGILGMDIISLFDYILLDFKNMRFSLGNTEK